MEVIESQRREIDHSVADDEQLRRDQLLLQEQLSEQNRDLREAHEKSLNEMEELERFQGSTFDTISRRKLIRDSRYYPWTHRQDYRNCKMKSILWLIWENFKMLSQYAVDNPTLPVNQRYSHLVEILAECKAVLWECWAATISRQTFGTRMVYRKTFL